MKARHFIAAALLGLALGIPVASRMASVKKDAAGTPAAAPPPQPERKTGFSVQAVVDQRDPQPAIRSARDLIAFKRAAATRPGSPFRSVPLDKAAIDDLPVGELIALLEAGELHDSKEIIAALDRWLKADALAVWEKFPQLPLSEFGRRAARNTVFAYWAEHQPERMLAMLEQLPESESKDVHAAYFLFEWQKANPGQALQFLDRLTALGASVPNPAKIGEDLLAAWMGKDKQAATEWLESLPAGQTKDALEKAVVLVHLGQMPPDQAVQWISEHPGTKVAQERLPTLLKDWAEGEPAAALLRLAEFPENHPIWGEDAAGIAQRAMMYATMSDSGESLATTVDQLPEGLAKRQLLLGMIQSSVDGDAAAETRLNSHRPGSREREQALKSRELAMAMRLLALLPESPEREQAVSYFTQYLGGNAAPVGEWVKGLKPSASRDTATERYATTVASSQPTRAAEWADSIPDPAQAAAARRAVHTRWHVSDPAAADQWRETWPEAPAEGE